MNKIMSKDNKIYEELKLETVNALQTHIREKIKEIGICDSIKQRDIKFYNTLILLFKNHDDPKKIKRVVDNAVDIKIQENEVYHTHDLIVMYTDINDNTLKSETISWKCCTSKKIKANTKMTKTFKMIIYRTSIEPQIQTFRNETDKKLKKIY
jgi:hypothetical protein